jgi:phosphoserine aminotransferase
MNASGTRRAASVDMTLGPDPGMIPGVSAHIWNFSPGPAVLPGPVLEEARERIRELDGSGMSVLEVSHRSPWFDAILADAERGIRELLAVPDDGHVLFLQGGASLQFAMAAMNLFRDDRGPAAFLVTGSWASKAREEARRLGPVHVVWDGASTGYDRIPDPVALSFPSDAAFVHLTSNETIEGVQWRREPEVPAGVPLVCDMSSDLLSRPVDLSRYGLVYAGAQKNAGPAGVTIVIVRDAVLERIPDGLAAMLDYRTHVRSGSRYNTPPVFAISVVASVVRWLRDDIGGLDAIAVRNEEKASLLYDAIDRSDGFYRGHARTGDRSRMNVTFRIADEALEVVFLEKARSEGLLELRGHRSVGGLRASIYNAMPIEGVSALASFMTRFRERHRPWTDP